MKRLTQALLQEARVMMKAWKEANPDGDTDWKIREIAGIKGVSYKALKKKI